MTINHHWLQENVDRFRLTPRVAVIDLETPAQDSHSAILTIGVVIVDLLELKLVDHFYQPLELTHQQHHGRTIYHQPTHDWWMREDNAEARQYAYHHDQAHRVNLREAITRLNRFLAGHFPQPTQVQLFGNGPEFDNTILANAAAAADIELYGYYGGNQSLRTLVLLGRLLLGQDPKYSRPFVGIQHHALHDAVHEAEVLLDIWTSLVHRLQD